MSVDYVRELQALRRKASGRARSKRNVSSRRHLGLERLESRQLLTAGVELMEPEAWIVPAVLEDGTAQEAWAVPAETLLISDEALRTPLMAWEEVPMGDGTAEPVFVTFAAFDAEPLMLKAEMEESVPVAYEAGAVEVLAGTDESTWEKPFVASLDDSGDDRIYMMTMMSVDANLDSEVATTEFDSSEIKRSLIVEAPADLGDGRAWEVDTAEIMTLMDAVGTEETVTFEATTLDDMVSVLGIADTDVVDDVPIRMTRTDAPLDGVEETAEILTLGESAEDDVILYATMDSSEEIEEIVELTSTSFSPWQNLDNPNDVNNDGFVTALDVLIVINQLNARTDLSASPLTVAVSAIFVDVDGDFLLDAGDALRIMNALNSPTVYEPPAIEASRLAPAWISDADSGDGWLGDATDDSLLLDEPLVDNEGLVFSDEMDWLLPELM